MNIQKLNSSEEFGLEARRTQSHEYSAEPQYTSLTDFIKTLFEEKNYRKQGIFIKGLYHVVDIKQEFYLGLAKLLSRSQIPCVRLAEFIINLLANYYYIHKFCKNLLFLAQIAIPTPYHLNMVKLQFIKSVIKNKEQKTSKSALDVKLKKFSTRVMQKPFFQLYDVEFLAKQFCAMYVKLINQIRATELLFVNFSGKEKAKNSPNLQLMSSLFNRISCKITTECLIGDEQTRAKSITFFIQLADYLYKLNNFDMVMCIMGALNNVNIQRLKRSWKNINNEYLLVWDTLEEFVSCLGNYKNYRMKLEELKLRNLPFVPILSICLRDITFIEEGNPNRVGETPNVEKILMIGETLSQVFNPFSTIYTFTASEKFLRKVLSLPPVADDELLMELSYQKEPKEGSSPSLNSIQSRSDPFMSRKDDDRLSGGKSNEWHNDNHGGKKDNSHLRSSEGAEEIRKFTLSFSSSSVQLSDTLSLTVPIPILSKSPRTPHQRHKVHLSQALDNIKQLQHPLLRSEPPNSGRRREKEKSHSSKGYTSPIIRKEKINEQQEWVLLEMLKEKSPPFGSYDVKELNKLFDIWNLSPSLKDELVDSILELEISLFALDDPQIVRSIVNFDDSMVEFIVSRITIFNKIKSFASGDIVGV